MELHMAHMVRILRMAALVTVLAQPALAQRSRARGAQAKPDTGKVAKGDTLPGLRKTADGSAYLIDFQQQDIGVVLSAIARAGGLNISLANLPAKNITFSLNTPVTRQGMIEVLEGVAAS